MRPKRVLTILGCVSAVALVLTACGSTKKTSSTTKAPVTTTSQKVTKSDVSNAKQLLISNKKWKYNAKNKVYYQVGLKYGTKTKSTYESMGIYVPASYVNAKSNGNKTYTLTLNTKNKVKGYTSKTAPMVMPVNAPGYAAQAAPTGYDSSTAKFTKAGFIYVEAGFRGLNNTDKSNGSSPWGVTDLKAAIRTLHLNANRLAGDTSRIFTFGMSGGGAESAVVGATGNSRGYTKYLKKIGAPMATASGKHTRDNVDGAMAWCPITSLDTANEAYEWNMGQYSNSGTRKSGTWTKALSNDMAKNFAQYINKIGLKDENGKTLTLKKSKTGIYTSGSYEKYLKKEIETSLNNFLKDTTFPYKASNSMTAGMNISGSNTSGTTGAAKSGTKPSGKLPSGSKTGKSTGTKPSGNMPGGSSSSTSNKTYKTAKAYIKSLNKNGTWVKYNAKKNTATITSVKAFIKNSKEASKDVGAFDGLTRQETENGLFATSGSSTNHFDSTMSKLINNNSSKYSKLKNYKSSYGKAFKADLKKTDAEGSTMQERLNLYSPLYYLSSYYKGYNTSNVAKYWRIRTGIDQTDTALTTETNLKLALQQNKQVKSVNFATVWGEGHTTAERSGNYLTNFIKWVNKSVK